MSPFSIFLKQLRSSRKLKQKQMAILLGYEPSYLSSLERSEKGPPRKDFINRLIRGLDLSQNEQDELAEALQASRKQLTLPSRASEREYALFRQLEPQLGCLHPLQIELIELVLQIPNVFPAAANPLNTRKAIHHPMSQEVPKM